MEVIKNQDLVQLFDRDTTVAQFIVQDLVQCQINKYTLYAFTCKIEGQHELTARFDASNYMEDGNIFVDSNLDPTGTKEKTFLFQIRAETFGFYTNLTIALTLGCFNETHLETLLLDPQPTYDFYRELPQEGSWPVFKLYFDKAI